MCLHREAERDTCIKAIDIISNIWKNDLQALLFLKELPCSKAFVMPDSSVEILALARISRESEQAFICLQDLAESGNETAIIELVKITGDHPRTLTLIQNLAESGNETAMAEFIKIAGDHPQALPIIKSIVRTSRNQVLKSTAIEALFRYWKQDPDTIFLIKKAAQSGDNAEIRELVNNFREDPQVLSIVRDLALTGDEVAIEELAYHWQNEPETLPILLELAENGNKAAAIELALGWSTYRRTLFILRKAEIAYNRENHRDRYYFNQNQNDDVKIILRTLTQLKNKKNDKKINIENWLYKLGNYNEIPKMQHDLKMLKHAKRGIKVSFFSTLRTRNSDVKCLVNALHSLGITVETNSDVRGHNKQRINVDVVAVLEGDFDLGWTENRDGSFDLIADLWGVAKKHNQTELINGINRRYAAMESGYRRFAS